MEVTSFLFGKPEVDLQKFTPGTLSNWEPPLTGDNPKITGLIGAMTSPRYAGVRPSFFWSQGNVNASIFGASGPPTGTAFSSHYMYDNDGWWGLCYTKTGGTPKKTYVGGWVGGSANFFLGGGSTTVTLTNSISDVTLINFLGTRLAFFYGNEQARIFDESGPTFAQVTNDRPSVAGSRVVPSKITPTGSDLPDPDDDVVRGVVQYYISIIDQATNAESAVSAPVTWDAEGGQSVKVSINTATLISDGSCTTGDSVQIYRSYANRFQPYAIPEGRVAVDGTTQDFEDRVADEELGELPLWHGDTPPKYVRDVVEHKGRLFALADDDSLATSSELFWSDPTSYTSWWTAANGNRISVGTDDGEKGYKLWSRGDDLIIIRKNSVYKLTGSISDEFSLKRIQTGGRVIGAETKWATVTSPKGIYMLRQGQLWLLSSNDSFTNISKKGISAWTSFIASQNTDCALGYSHKFRTVFLRVKDWLWMYNEDSEKWVGSVYVDPGNLDRFINLPPSDQNYSSDFYALNGNENLLAACSADLSVAYLWGTATTPKTFNVSPTADPGTTPEGGNVSISPILFDGRLKRFHYLDVFSSIESDNGMTFTRKRINIGTMGHFLSLKVSSLSDYYATDDPATDVPGNPTVDVYVDQFAPPQGRTPFATGTITRDESGSNDGQAENPYIELLSFSVGWDLVNEDSR